MDGFVQIVEIRTSRIDDVLAPTDDMRSKASEGATVRRGTYTRDEDRAGNYIAIIELDSRETTRRTGTQDSAQGRGIEAGAGRIPPPVERRIPAGEPAPVNHPNSRSNLPAAVCRCRNAYPLGSQATQ